MTIPNTKWFDFDNNDQCRWAVRYLLKKAFPQADRMFLRKLMSPQLDAYRQCQLKNKEELQLLRVRMEKAWRVRCSREKNSRKNPRSVSISAESQLKLKRLAAKKQQSASECLNHLIAESVEREAYLRKDFDNEILRLKKEYKKKLKIAGDKARSIARAASICKKLVNQQMHLAALQVQLETLSKHLALPENQAEVNDGLRAEKIEDDIPQMRLKEQLETYSEQPALSQSQPEGNEEIKPEKVDCEMPQLDIVVMLAAVERLLEGNTKIQKMLNFKTSLEPSKGQSGQGIGEIYREFIKH